MEQVEATVTMAPSLREDDIRPRPRQSQTCLRPIDAASIDDNCLAVEAHLPFAAWQRQRQLG
ncbi:uncharacterized protein QC761_0015770 [Podospora bellae-mahoneyi]|uniref:Uncharacterized protein n=1 Tax=Podospora bellae-mahoneyi TaxID=2093777 RepID=A0ABR0FZK3_9PEZI|nr:hypothetical protein QC761_0015770 [Podospora bellae-mahoneyi]